MPFNRATILAAETFARPRGRADDVATTSRRHAVRVAYHRKSSARDRMSCIEGPYRVSAPRDQLDAIAQAIALEQSVELPAEVVTNPFVARNVMGRVAS